VKQVYIEHRAHPGGANFLIRFVDCFSFLDGFRDFYIFDGHGIDLERVFVAEHEFGELASIQRAFRLFFGRLSRGIDSDGFQRLRGCDAPIGADDHSGARNMDDGRRTAYKRSTRKHLKAMRLVGSGGNEAKEDTNVRRSGASKWLT
jgi:hypothetical protein